MSDYKEKLAKAKSNIKKPSSNGLMVLGDEDVKKIHEAVATMHLKLTNLVKEKETEATDRNSDQFMQLKNSIGELSQALSGGIEKSDIEKIVEKISAIEFNPKINVPTPIANVNNKIVVQDWRKDYIFSDSDKTKSVTYVGFVSPTGSWYIERVNKSETSDKARFVFGSSDYVSNWGSRLKLNYKLLFEAYPNGKRN